MVWNTAMRLDGERPRVGQGSKLANISPRERGGRYCMEPRWKRDETLTKAGDRGNAGAEQMLNRSLRGERFQ